jgi:hypothetical protein
MSFGSSEQF